MLSSADQRARAGIAQFLFFATIVIIELVVALLVLSIHYHLVWCIILNSFISGMGITTLPLSWHVWHIPRETED